MIRILAAFILTISATGGLAQGLPEILEGCEGDLCGCTKETKSDKDFALYEKPDLKSKKVGNFKAGTEASLIGAFSKVLDRGRYKVTAVKDPNLKLKVGDDLDTVFYLGDAYYKARTPAAWIRYTHSQLNIDLISGASYERWFQVSAGKASGFSPEFPFKQCEP